VQIYRLIKELEELNQAFRNRDKMKDDAIAQLSDQVMALTTRMQEIERKQQPYIVHTLLIINYEYRLRKLNVHYG
jgi:hypothetical protein